MKISTIHGLQRYVKRNSYFNGRTINSVIIALGFHPLYSTSEEFKELSNKLVSCSEHGADSGITGFIYFNETIPFFKKHRQDIIYHMENTAEEMGTDIISMVQNFGVFYRSEKPKTSVIGKALWDSKSKEDFTTLHIVFAWYALEEVSRTWYRYLEDNPAYMVELAA